MISWSPIKKFSSNSQKLLSFAHDIKKLRSYNLLILAKIIEFVYETKFIR